MSDGDEHDSFALIRDIDDQRIGAEVEEGIYVGIKMLAEDHPRRVDKGVLAYAVIDLTTPLGDFRIRDVEIVRSKLEAGEFYVRYRQWPAGARRGPTGAGDWLDVAGPRNKETRNATQNLILDLFDQIREEAAAGTLPRESTERRTTGRVIDPKSKTAEDLQGLKDALEAQGAQPEEPAAAEG